jgi:3-hydroxyacyl-CoA dehydrogenase
MKLSLGIRLPIIGVVQTFDFQGLDVLLDTMKNYGRIYSFVEDRVKKAILETRHRKAFMLMGAQRVIDP